jgi:hypothetical protein
MSRNLVLARVGAHSLDSAWLENGESRGFDLRLVPYEPIGPRDRSVAVGPVLRGPKWSGLAETLARWEGWRDYDFVWLPDDDLLADAPQIDRMFEAASRAELDLFAPALSPTSYFAHFDTMHNESFHGRRVGFVEILCPGFSRAALEQLAFTLSLSETGWGWGLDSVWPKLLDYRGVGILDGVTVTHTRPVGAMRDSELRERVHAESERLLSTFGCHQVHTTFDAFDESFTTLARSPEDLVPELSEGWRYLIDRDSRVTQWISAYQQPDAYCPHYPCEGTPGGGYAFN